MDLPGGPNVIPRISKWWRRRQRRTREMTAGGGLSQTLLTLKTEEAATAREPRNPL